MRYVSLIALMAAGLPAIAEDSRQLDAHVHGQGVLNIAIEGDQLAIELEAPGFDIVGFEHPATSDQDVLAIETAMAVLTDPSKIFTLPDTAGCTATNAVAKLHTEEEDDDHDHNEHDEEDDHAEGEDHDDHDHDGDEHAEKDEHDHKEHVEGEDHDHGDEEHAEDEKHDEHDHDGHDHAGEEASHTEFHAEYSFTCTDMTALTQISLPYFATFANAEELEVQYVSDAGATALEATPDAPTLDLTQAN